MGQGAREAQVAAVGLHLREEDVSVQDSQRQTHPHPQFLPQLTLALAAKKEVEVVATATSITIWWLRGMTSITLIVMVRVDALL